MPDFIPVYAPVLGEEEWQNVRECLETTWISSKGRFVDAFETEFADTIGARHAVAVCNGTVALHLALLALGIGSGDRVAVPTFTYVAPVNAIRYVGAEPVFVDCDPVTLQISVEDLAQRAAGTRLNAILVVHLYGHPTDMSAVRGFADAHRLQVIEDCAEAFGARIGDVPVGSFGDIATYSFFGNKTVTTGEGGMVTTGSEQLAKRIRKFKGQGLAEGREYWHDTIGYNYRMTNICAAIGVAQLRRAPEFLDRKRAIAAFYRKMAAPLGLGFHDETKGTTHSFWMCSIFTRNAEEREPFRNHLRAHGIETRPCFYPVHTMPMYREWDLGGYTVSEDVAYRGINLPSSPALSDEHLERIRNVVQSYFRP